MQRTRKKQEQTFQTVIPVNRYLGMNKGATRSMLEPGESQFLVNWDIFAGEKEDFIKTRRGSAYLRKASGPSKRGSTYVANQITWDVGSEEYLITQEGTGMYSQALIATGNPVAIALATGGGFALGSTTQADLFLSGDKLYVFHPSGNFVIRWTGSVFVAYSMGLTFPHILAVTSANAGVITGSYTLGIEKVYRVSGVDMMASTPNRKIATTRVLATTGTISAKKIKITLQDAELDNDTLWTHIRVWRSKNKNADNTDPLNPIDAQGNDDELYEEALITKAEIEAGSLTSVATGATLPPGNAGTQAGNPGSVYTIELNNADSVFFNLIGIEQIELLPIPAATTGCFCANRIFFSGVQDAALDDASKNNIWYSNFAGTKYAFQYNPLNFIDTGRDGQNMMKLIAFEKDVIGIKEAKTGRLPSGNVDLPYQTLDERIGISHKNLATFIPTVGIAAITSDYNDFRIFGYDLRWTNLVNGRDVSLPIRTYTALTVPARATMIYINGKLILCTGYSTAYNTFALHVKEGRGWSAYEYQVVLGDMRLFTFAQGSRAAIVSPDTHLVEIEVSGQDGDVVTSSDTQQTYLTATERTYPFQRSNGRDILEHECLSFSAILPVSYTATCYAFANHLHWPNPASPTNFSLVPPAGITAPSAIDGTDSINDREYQLYVQPGTIGGLKWCPLAANFLTYEIIVRSPATIRSKRLHCLVDENGMAWGGFDPWQRFPTTNTDPTWAQ
jgi:hypothetical protein